jgi:hypothetical protein
VIIKRVEKFDKAKLKVESGRSNYIHGDARNFWKFKFVNKIVTNSNKTNKGKEYGFFFLQCDGVGTLGHFVYLWLGIVI